MTTFNAALLKWQAFNPVSAASTAMLENKEQIIGVNQHQLYELGEGSDGQPLEPYTKAYAKTKPRPSIVDIWRTGNLQSKMVMRVEGGEYEINSPVPYAQFLLGKRPKIFGLDEEGKKTTWHIIQPGFVEVLKVETGAG